MIMYSLLYPIILSVHLTASIYASIWEQTSMLQEESSVSLAFSVCYNTVLKSAQPLFHVADFNFGPSVPGLIQLLHESSIQTVLITHSRELKHLSVTSRAKNVIFFVDHIGEVLNLMMNSGAKPRKYNTVPKELILSEVSNVSKCMDCAKDYDRATVRNLFSYCIRFDGVLLQPKPDYTCDETLNVTSDELQDSSMLSDSTFKMTRSLHGNRIWNSNNYLIFMLKKVSQENCNFNKISAKRSQNFGGCNNVTINNHRMGIDVFFFKFFWRFFNGLRLVICYDIFARCERYDPFLERIIAYEGKHTESYFDFSWKDMRNKTVGFLIDVDGRRPGIENLKVWNYWLLFLYDTLQYVEKSINCTFEGRNSREYTFLDPNYEIFEFDIGQKLGAPLQIINFAKIFSDIDLSEFDYSVGLETAALCIITPHSELIPQYLVILKAFSPKVWIFILTTIAIFILTQYTYQYSQRTIFQRFYLETKIRLYGGTSSLLTVYSYFICGSPPCLLLGRFYTGKIIFTVFSFSALIISTVFLDGMTTLLTSQMRYPEMETLEEFKASDILLQMSDPNASGDFLLREEENARLAAKFTRSFQSLLGSAALEMEQNSDLFGFMWNIHDDGWNWTVESEDEYVREFTTNVRNIMETDAFLESVPQIIRSNTRDVTLGLPLVFGPRSPVVEYHLIQECLFTYPVLFPIYKDSYLFEKVNSILARSLETGHAEACLKAIIRDEFNKTVANLIEDGEPRPYDLKDLRLAFLILFVGLFLSFLAFVTELLVDFFGRLNVLNNFKHIGRLFRFISKKAFRE